MPVFGLSRHLFFYFAQDLVQSASSSCLTTIGVVTFCLIVFFFLFAVMFSNICIQILVEQPFVMSLLSWFRNMSRKMNHLQHRTGFQQEMAPFPENGVCQPVLPWDDNFTHADSRLDHHLYPGMLFHFPDYLLSMDLPHQCSLGQGRGVIPATVKMGTAYATSSSVEKGGFLAFACPAPPPAAEGHLLQEEPTTFTLDPEDSMMGQGVHLHCQGSWSPDEKRLKHLSIGQIYDFSWPPFQSVRGQRASSSAGIIPSSLPWNIVLFVAVPCKKNGSHQFFRLQSDAVIFFFPTAEPVGCQFIVQICQLISLKKCLLPVPFLHMEPDVGFDVVKFKTQETWSSELFRRVVENSVFLLPKVTAARVSEIYALSADPGFCSSEKLVLFGR